MRKHFGQLIRDRIPEILEAEGLRYELAELDDAAFRSALLAKLQKEAAEVAGARGAREMTKEFAGLFEVIDAVLDLHGLDPEAVRAVQAQRRAERGGFVRRLELVWTEQ